ncbi:MAG: hypothetical protein K6T83_23990, partial [Alicyclobacillus sp.]|nr:hypothetical protein [Alicyclobacillus sp.]
RYVGGMSSTHLVNYVAVSQLMLWISTFLPADLGVSVHIRTGQIALEFVRPMGYLPRTLWAGAGEIAYNAVFRSVPLAITFTLLGVMPWSDLDGAARIIMVIIAMGFAGLGGLLFQYLIGIAAFWTIETRWSRRLYLALVTLCGGQIIPLQLMPSSLHEVLSWLPFQTLLSFPILVWMHLDTLVMWCTTVVWTAILFGICTWLTKLGQRRVEVQGG